MTEPDCVTLLPLQKSISTVTTTLTYFRGKTSAVNSPVSSSQRPPNRRTEDSFIQGQPRPKVKYSQNTGDKVPEFEFKTQKQLYTGLVLTGVCEYINLRSRLTGINESSVLLFSGRDEFETGLFLRAAQDFDVVLNSRQ